jgi:hypothetical protein
VEDLLIRCGALREAESTWGIEWRYREEAEKLWLVESPKGYELRNQIAHHFYYAFQDSPSLIVKLKKFLKGTTHAEMIQCLNNLSVLGLSNQELLRKIGFDLKLLDMAVKKSRELARKKEAASFYSEDYLEVKKIRDQAYTHLKEAVDLIYDCGKYVFCENSARLKGYSSNHLRLKRMRWKIRYNLPEPEPEP